MNRLARFNAQIAKTWNAQVWPAMQHQDSRNAYLYPKPARTPGGRQPKPAVTTYKTTRTTLAQPVAPSPEALERDRQAAILATRLANLEKARAVKAANAGKRQPVQETAPVTPVSQLSEIDALRNQIAALSAQIERMSQPVSQPAPVARVSAPAKAKQASPPAKPARTPYVPTALALTNHGHGRYSLKIDATLITLAWNGAERRWDYIDVRRAALALAREVERRLPKNATSKWWKEERHGVFVDYNQNARDRTIASGYSVRPVPDARVCCPIEWEEVPDVEPAELRLDTVPARIKKQGDPAAAIDENAGSLDQLLDLARRDEEGGLGDAPWPPHFAKQRGEPRRVAPSRARKG